VTDERINSIAIKHALKNAVEHGGKAAAGPVINKVLGDLPEARSDMKTLGKTVTKTVAEVNSLSVEEQKKRLLEIWPDALEKKPEKPKEFPELPGNTSGVVLRFAPNPNGPPTIGSARGAYVNWYYARRYGGKFVLRFDDTDPKTKPPMPEAYDWYLEDFRWLFGEEPDEVYYLSDMLPEAYEYCEKLIRTGKAYSCKCSQEEGRKYRTQGKACPHRNQTPEENMKEWKRMLSGEYKEGEITIRIKTDLKAKDPAHRDFVAFKITYAPHPRTGTKYHVWPALDFIGAIADKIIGVTHIIRGKDLRDSTTRQEYVYKYLGWKYPVTLYWGRLKVHGFGKLSTSQIRKGIEEGKYSGWDDPKLPTLKALKKRGITPEALREWFKSMGFTERDVAADLQILEAINRKQKHLKTRKAEE